MDRLKRKVHYAKRPEKNLVAEEGVSEPGGWRVESAQVPVEMVSVFELDLGWSKFYLAAATTAEKPAKYV